MEEALNTKLASCPYRTENRTRPHHRVRYHWPDLDTHIISSRRRGSRTASIILVALAGQAAGPAMCEIDGKGQSKGLPAREMEGGKNSEHIGSNRSPPHSCEVGVFCRSIKSKVVRGKEEYPSRQSQQWSPGGGPISCPSPASRPLLSPFPPKRTAGQKDKEAVVRGNRDQPPSLVAIPGQGGGGGVRSWAAKAASPKARGCNGNSIILLAGVFETSLQQYTVNIKNLCSPLKLLDIRLTAPSNLSVWDLPADWQPPPPILFSSPGQPVQLSLQPARYQPSMATTAPAGALDRERIERVDVVSAPPAPEGGVHKYHGCNKSWAWANLPP